MAEFFSVKRADTGNVVVINADAIEHVEVNGGVPLPALDDMSQLTDDHLETLTIHFIGDDPANPTLGALGQGSIKVSMSLDRFQSVVKGSIKDTAEKVAQERKTELAKMTADRQKERTQAQQNDPNSPERTVKRRASKPRAPKAPKAARKAKAKA